MSEHRRPKIGDRVWFEGTVSHDDGEKFIQVAVSGARPPSDGEAWFDRTALTVLPAAPEPRPDWEVLRDAADILERTRPNSTISSMLYEEATRLEAAARPKPTLLEAVKAYDAAGNVNDIGAMRKAWDAVKEALARADAA